MAQQQIVLGVLDIQHNTPWEGAAELDAALIEGGGAAYLRYVDRVGNSIRIRLAASATDPPDDPGPEFTPAVETHSAALTFAEAGGSSITLKGPGHPNNAFADSSDPYYWTPDNAPAWTAWVAGVGAGDVTLTISDGVAPVLELGALSAPGFVVEAAALLEASGATILYADADRGGSDVPLAGELGLGDGETVVSRIRTNASDDLRLNDNDNPEALILEDYFLDAGRWIFLRTLAHGQVGFPTADYTSASQAGGGYANLSSLPADVRSLIADIGVGDRFIFAVGRQLAELSGIARAAIRVYGALGASAPLAGIATAAIRTRGVLNARARLAGVLRASIRTAGALRFPTPLAGVVRAAIQTRGVLDFVSRPGGVASAEIRIRGPLRAVLPAGAYFTTDGDVLDEICWRRYGRENAVPAVLAANPRLADASPVLPAGVLVVLPDLPAAPSAISAERLWDVVPPWVMLPERERHDIRLGGAMRAAVRFNGLLT